MSHVYVDQEKYEAGIRKCCGKILAPGMNHCYQGDRIQTIEGKRGGVVECVQYTAPLQAVIVWDDGTKSTTKLHLLERRELCDS